MFVGDVLQGRLVNPISEGYSLKASQVPQAGRVGGDLGFQGEPGDQIFQFSVDSEGKERWFESTWVSPTDGWVPDIHIAVAEGFMVLSQSSKRWIREFTVN